MCHVVGWLDGIIQVPILYNPIHKWLITDTPTYFIPQDEIVDNEDSDDDMFDDNVEESNQSLQPIIKSNTDHPKEIIQILCSEKENQQQKVEVESGFKTNSASKEQTYKSPAKAGNKF